MPLNQFGSFKSSCWRLFSSNAFYVRGNSIHFPNPIIMFSESIWQMNTIKDSHCGRVNSHFYYYSRRWHLSCCSEGLCSCCVLYCCNYLAAWKQCCLTFCIPFAGRGNWNKTVYYCSLLCELTALNRCALSTLQDWEQCSSDHYFRVQRLNMMHRQRV